MKLYDYFRSSAAYRVRIALNLKGVTPERAFVHLRHGAQRDDDYLALNPQGLVPSLVTDEGDVLTQSLAIIEWLDETHPEPPLLPPDAVGRALACARSRSRSPAISIRSTTRACCNYLTGTLGVSEDAEGRLVQVLDRHRPSRRSRRALRASRRPAASATGTTPTLADICLVPQMANARRVDFDFAPYPTLLRIESACIALPAFANAAPAKQPDAE